MIKVLFICHGNICRSPIAEFIFKNLVQKAGLTHRFFIDSAATSREELGNDIYPPAKQIMKQNNIVFSRHSARQITSEDLFDFDYIITMERYNNTNLQRLFGSEAMKKVCLLMDFTDRPGDVSDPWYSGDFQTTFDDISYGCSALLHFLLKKQ